MKFHKRPIEIEAVQYLVHNRDEIIEVLGCSPNDVKESTIAPVPYLEIKTLEGVMRAQMHDWIIRGVAGEIYPCKPDIFAKTYVISCSDPELEHDCTGCTDRHSEGTHQGCTKQHGHIGCHLSTTDEFKL